MDAWGAGAAQGAKLHRVSDLLLLGRATIEESLFLLQWLAKQGHAQLGEPQASSAWCCCRCC